MSYSECQTVKKGHVCVHMNKTRGCVATPEGRCFTSTYQCAGCEYETRQDNNRLYCDVYARPRMNWNRGVCPMATHVIIEKEKTKKRINPLKASKRGV